MPNANGGPTREEVRLTITQALESRGLRHPMHDGTHGQYQPPRVFDHISGTLTPGAGKELYVIELDRAMLDSLGYEVLVQEPEPPRFTLPT